MMALISYNKDSFLAVRFYNHAVMGLKRDLPEHKWENEKYIEKAGDFLVWSVERLPKIVWGKLQDPRAVTITLTVAALLGNSFLFYPLKTRESLIRLVNEIQKLPFAQLWMFKFAAYIGTCSVIIGYASRAYGRFSNEDLMKKFYDNKLVATE